MDPLTDEDKKELRGVLNVAEEVLGRCSDPWSDLLFPEPLRKGIQDAWPEVKKRIGEVRDQIDGAPGSGKIAQDLGNAGLLGKPLRAKTAGLFGWFAKFKRLGSVRLLKKILRWLNTLLGSLASAIPLSELIKEHKEAIENGIEDGEEGDFEEGKPPDDSPSVQTRRP